ncbi:MAG: cupin domain-containing protein [Tatlockia sp.]|nr:cupin domain-containing protein [Tatlockia sp.]
MRKHCMFKDTNRFSFLDGLKIEILAEDKMKIHSKDKIFNFSDDNKMSFDSGTGEVVIEYSGLATDGESAQSYAKASFAPLGKSAKHVHNFLTEDYYIFSGKGLVIIDEKIHEVSAGNHIHIAPGQVHQVINNSENLPLKLIVRCIPAWEASDFNLVSEDLPTTSFDMK